MEVQVYRNCWQPICPHMSIIIINNHNCQAQDKTMDWCGRSLCWPSALVFKNLILAETLQYWMGPYHGQEFILYRITFLWYLRWSIIFFLFKFVLEGNVMETKSTVLFSNPRYKFSSSSSKIPCLGQKSLKNKKNDLKNYWLKCIWDTAQHNI